jgi:hypothetical protein
LTGAIQSPFFDFLPHKGDKGAHTGADQQPAQTYRFPCGNR